MPRSADRTRGRLVAARPIVVAVLALAALAPTASAQAAIGGERLTVEKYLDFEAVADPVISPDARRVVYTRRWVDPSKDRFGSTLWMIEADGTRNRQLRDGSNARWSPDGTRILFVDSDDDGKAQIFVRWMDAEGAVTQVTRVAEAPQNPQWSPDGRSIAFAAFVPASSSWPIDLPAPPEGATWTEPPRIIERTHFRADRRGFLEDGNTHLFVVPAEGGTPRQLTEGAWSVGGSGIGLPGGAPFDWSPDGRALVFAAMMEDADTLYRQMRIHAVDVESGGVRSITDTKGAWSGPRVSPDGSTVAFTGFPFTTQTYRASELWLADIGGGNMRSLTAAFDRDPQDVTWAPDGRSLYFTAQSEGAQQLYRVTAGGDVTALTEGRHLIDLASMSAGGAATAVVRGPHEPGDAYVLRTQSPNRMTRLTRVNEDVLERVALGEVEEVWYDVPDGTRVQGWIVKPPDFDPSGEYPLILHIHGGPHAMYNTAFSYAFQNFAAHDYVVLYTNPRGSTGYGTDFGNAIDNGYPSVDYDDLMAGVEEVVGRGYVDTSRMYVTGCSGGGVLSSWVIGNTDRFAAAGVRCPVVNWMSFAGTADIVTWGYHRFEGFPWTNPEKYLAHSPLMLVGNVTTPTAVMTGELDLRTPMSQSEEYFQALRAEGVPAVLFRFNDEYHGTGSKPSNFMRTQLYLMSWFERWHRDEAGNAVESGEDDERVTTDE
ncbi:MAG TPA: S9 family peptidase [Longimicrobiales bacterium]|nr:S9 family peptidase [Longimicrobiales bacterium]